jgi:hypothetical protein
MQVLAIVRGVGLEGFLTKDTATGKNYQSQELWWKRRRSPQPRIPVVVDHWSAGIGIPAAIHD